VVDYRVGARIRTDMEIFSKTHYYGAIRIRTLELMCLTQFLPGAHNVMIFDACEELETRAGLVKAFYNRQSPVIAEHNKLGDKLG